MLPGYDYDFEMTIRPDEEFSKSIKRKIVTSYLEQLPGVKPEGDNAFAFNSPVYRWMDITPEMRRWDGEVGERIDGGDDVNCIHLCIPARVRGPEKERDYFTLAFSIADQLGWLVFDDTDSGCCLGKSWLEMHFPQNPAPKPWWKLW